MQIKFKKEIPHEGYAFLIIIFIFWEIIAQNNWVDSNYFPPISDILTALISLTASFEIIGHILISLKRVLAGFILGLTVGYIMGFACGYNKIIYHLLEFTIEFLRPMPSVALIPIGILFLGMGDAFNIVIAGWACSWPVFINTMDGVRSVDHLLIDTGRSFGLSRFGIIRKIIIPACMPYVFTGLRVSLGIAVAVVVITEMVVSGKGLGSFIFNTSISYRIPQMYAGIIVIGFFGYILNVVFVMIEKSVINWHLGSTGRE
jgi:NitT/TauT family transport system permease protein